MLNTEEKKMWSRPTVLWLSLVVVLIHAQTSGACTLDSREVTQVGGCTLATPAIETRCSGGCYSTSQTLLGYNPTTEYTDCDCCQATLSSQSTVTMDCPYAGPGTMTATCDNQMKVYFNNVLQDDPNGQQDEWRQSSTYNVPAGTTEVKIECTDVGVLWGIMASFDDGQVTDDSWNCWTATADSAPATIVGDHGSDPWKEIAGISDDAKWIWTASNETDPRWAADVTCTKQLNISGASTRELQYTVIEQCGCSDCKDEVSSIPMPEG